MTSTNMNGAKASSGQELTGAIWQGNEGAVTAAQFHWKDEESGQLLKIQVEGDESFFRGLENLGFIRRRAGNFARKITETINGTPRRTPGHGPQLPGWQGRCGV